jgi:diguanylate cyclase (GGDEF)-like protein
VKRPAYGIDPLLAEFEDPVVELAFREYSLDTRVHDTRLAVGLGAMFYVAFAFTDFLNVGANLDYLHILLTRLGIAGLGILVAWQARRHWRWLVNGTLPTLVVASASIGLLSITLNRPFDIGWHGMSMMVMLLGTYVFIPNRFMPAVVVAVIASLAFIWLMLLNFHPGPATVVTLITLLLVLNILGIMAAYRISRMQRETYMDGAILQEANQALQLEMRRREALEEDLRELIERDPLTGLPNRANFFPRALELLDSAGRDGSPLGFILADVDYFRQINATYGHSRADEVLQALAICCRDVVPPGAVYARLGGDDLAIMLLGADATATSVVAEKLRIAAKETTVEADDCALNFTVSVGVVQWLPGESINALLRRADNALSAAKYKGRDRVESSRRPRAAGGMTWS